MASSVARMPAADDWRDASRLTGVFASHHHHPFSLRKVLVRERHASSHNSCIVTPTPAPSHAAKSPDPPASPATAARHRQSQILDRWAARQAREMITTIERQTHEAEISALSSTSKSVSSRAATFLRETSPSLSDSSYTSAAAPPHSPSTVAPPPVTVAPPPVTAAPATAPAPAPPSIELQSNVRASSLIQMWRELEAEAGMVSTPRGATNCASGNAVVSPSPSGSSDVCDESEAFGDWESEAAAMTDVSSSVADSERGRVENIVKMLSTAKMVQGSATSSWSDDNEHSGSDQRDCLASPRVNVMRVRGRREIEDLMVRLEQERRRELEQLLERQAVSRFPHRGRIQSLLRFMSLRRGLAARDQPKAVTKTRELDQLQKGSTICFLRQRFNDRSQQEGGAEPAAACSSSLHVQSPDSSRDSGSNCTADQFTKLSFNRQGQHDRSSEAVVDFSNSQRVQSLENSRNLGNALTSDNFIRQSCNHGVKHDERRELASEGSISLHVRLPDNSQDSCFVNASDPFNRQSLLHVRRPSLDILRGLHIQLRDRSSEESGYIIGTDAPTSDMNQHQQIAYARDPECTLLGANSPQSGSNDSNSPPSRSEDLQDGHQSIDGSWDERNLWVSNLDWQRPLDSSTQHSWQGEIVTGELEPYSHQDVRMADDTWISDSSNSWRTLDIRRPGNYNELLENFSDNVEIRELLERRRVTTSLASDFREKMNRLMISFLQRQGQYDTEGSDADQDEDHFVWRQNDDFGNSDQLASASSSLIPLPYQTMYQQENWQDTSLRQNSSQQLLEVEVVHDLRSDMSQIHNEIFELRKLVESCMDWQMKLQSSIKQEVSSGAICQPARIGDTSKWTPIRKGSCCICCEMPVDSLLYRCGHMCTCFKCAHELQWSSGRCPICRAPIVDVVRAYSNS